jgi:amino acid adenylation domain-containing protein
MLAIVANGAAYLPLDPNYPQERLSVMIEDAQPLLAVVDKPLQARLPEGGVYVPREALSGNAREHWSVKRSGALAYVLFTSGSTGRPKGVAMRTASVAALLEWQRAHARLGKPARTLQFAPLGFDVSFQEIFSTLQTGGTLILPTAAERRDPWALLELLQRERIERLFLPYVSLQALADVAQDACVPCLADVITAGEQLRITPAIRAWFATLPECVLHNQYGPTETHVVTAYELHGAAAFWPELPPIGAALPHVRTRLAHVSDEVGNEGELLLGGICLADGYIGRPELTAARFVEIDGERWYHSGDRVRRSGSGEFEYLGRLDEQIKIAGHRIEPAEIENVLCRHSAVAQAAVVAEERRGGRRLVAHIVPHALNAGDVVEKLLSAYCAAMLPEYLRPQAFKTHIALPTTPSGKLDRLALAQTQTPVTDIRWSDDVPLRDQLIELWQHLLGIKGLDTPADVFELGARSLDVVQALTELRRHGHRVTVAQIYEHPTIAAQLQLLGEPSPPNAQADVDPRAQQQRAALTRLAAAGASR